MLFSMRQFSHSLKVLFLCLVFFIPLPVILLIPSGSTYSSQHLPSIPSSSSVFDDSIIQVHHDFDEDIQDFPNAPNPNLAYDVPNLPNPTSILNSVFDYVPIVPRKSTRTSKSPSYLKAYHCNQVTSNPISNHSNSGTSHPLTTYLSYDNLSPAYKTFCCSISTIIEAKHYHQAVDNPKWQEAMDAEIAALEATNTWTLTFLPPSKKPIGCKWVFKVKYKLDGFIERYKARLVAKGFT